MNFFRTSHGEGGRGGGFAVHSSAVTALCVPRCSTVAASIGQIVAEVHFGDSEMRGGGWEMEQRELDILKNMQGAGWAMWRREDNEQGYEQYRSFLRGQGSCCFEVGWMRKTLSHS